MTALELTTLAQTLALGGFTTALATAVWLRLVRRAPYGYAAMFVFLAMALALLAGGQYVPADLVAAAEFALVLLLVSTEALGIYWAARHDWDESDPPLTNIL